MIHIKLFEEYKIRENFHALHRFGWKETIDFGEFIVFEYSLDKNLKVIWYYDTDSIKLNDKYITFDELLDIMKKST